MCRRCGYRAVYLGECLGPPLPLASGNIYKLLCRGTGLTVCDKYDWVVSDDVVFPRSCVVGLDSWGSGYLSNKPGPKRPEHPIHTYCCEPKLFIHNRRCFGREMVNVQVTNLSRRRSTPWNILGRGKWRGMSNYTYFGRIIMRSETRI